MLEVDQYSVSSDSPWQIVAEFSLYGEAACAPEAAAMVAEILARVHVPEPVLTEAKQAVARRMEALCRPAGGQSERSFTILVRTQPARLSETPANAASRQESRRRPKGWGFFLTDRIMTDAEMGHEMHHLVVSLHLYQEGHPA
jgi:hypothetical protein